MAYITAADFREATLAEYCSRLELDTDDASDQDITAAITRHSTWIDNVTSDHFESQTLTLELNGYGERTLHLPRRCTSITTLKTRWVDGTLTTQNATAYRLHSSLSTGLDAGALRLGDLDYIEVLLYGSGFSGVGNWNIWAFPYGEQSVEVTGSFGWTVTPAPIQRACALLVWNTFKPQADVLRQASSFTDAGASYNLSGLTEVDQVIAEYRRREFLRA